MALVAVKVCSVCGKVKRFNEFVEIPPELQSEINKSAINVDSVICPSCESK